MAKKHTGLTAVEALSMMNMMPPKPKRRRRETAKEYNERHQAALRSKAQHMRKKHKLQVVWKEKGEKHFLYSKEELQAVLRNRGKLIR